MTVGAKDLPTGPAPNAQNFFGGNPMPMMPQHEAAKPAPQVARREMKGPSGVDDILRTFEEVSRVEAQATGNYMPPPPNNSAAAMAAAEIQSLHSEEMSYVTERTNATGRRQKKRQAPVGNVMNLDV